jgi:hypothetical protein
MHTYAADAQVFAVASFIESHFTDLVTNNLMKSGVVNGSIWFHGVLIHG